MTRIIPEGSNYKQFATPGVVVIEVQPTTIIGERAVRVLQLIGDFSWGEENKSVTVNDFVDLRYKFGKYVDGLKGYLDAAAAFSQGPINVQIIRATPPDGTPTEAEYTVTNTHWYQDDAGNVVRFIAKNPTYDRPTNVTITDGSTPGTNVDIDILGPLYQDDAAGVVRFIYNGSGIGTGTSVLIEAGTLSGKKITINAGEVNEEVYDNVDMDELTPSSYIVDVINEASDLVRVVRLSGTNVDTLPTNQVETAMVTVVTENYTDLLMDESSPSTYIVDYINANSDLVVVERLSGLTVDTLPTLQSATAMSTSLTRGIVTFEAAVAGLDGNNIRVSIQDGTAGTKTISVTNLLTEQTETFSNLDMNDGVGATYIVDYINSNSSIITATRTTTNITDLLPRNINTVSLAGGSDGGLAYGTLTALDIVGNDIVTFKSKYRGSSANDISVKIINNNDLSVTVYIADGSQNSETYKKLVMNSTDSKYLVDYINLRSNLVTVERESSIVDNTLPVSISTFTYLSGGSNGDPINDLSIQNAIVVAGRSNYADIVTYGSQDHGTLYANAKALSDMVSSKRERIAVINSPTGASHTEAIAFVDEVVSPFVIVSHPEQYFTNPDTGVQEIISYAASYAGRLATLAFESSPSQALIYGSLGNTIEITTAGDDAESDALTIGGVSPIGFDEGYGTKIINGVNTSGDETNEQISTISMRAFIGRNLSYGLKPLVSKLHTKNLREKVKSAIESFLTRLFDEGRIGNPDSEEEKDTFRVDVSNALNTSAVIKAKTLIASVKVLLLAAADHILIRLEAGEGTDLTVR